MLALLTKWYHLLKVNQSRVEPGGGGGGAPTTKKIILPPGKLKNQDVLCLFCSFLKHLKNRRFCAVSDGFGLQNANKNDKEKIVCFNFFVLLAGVG